MLDNCCGSGSIPAAAALEDRRYIGMDNGVCEKEESPNFQRPWAEIASERIVDLLAAQAEGGIA